MKTHEHGVPNPLYVQQFTQAYNKGASKFRIISPLHGEFTAIGRFSSQMLSKGGRVFVSCRHQILDQQQFSRNNIHMARLCKTATVNIWSWWRHQMETFSALPALYGGNPSESTGHWWIPLTKASYAELWCFPWSVPEQTVQRTIETQVIWFVKHVVQYSALAIRCLIQLLSAIPCLFTTTVNILNICIFNP